METFFPGLFPGSRRNLFWLPCRETFAKHRVFCSMSENVLKRLILSKLVFIFKLFLWTLRIQFDNPAERCLTKSRKKFAHSPKMTRSNQTVFFDKTSSSQVVLVDTLNAVLTTLSKILFKKAERSYFSFLENEGTTFHSTKLLLKKFLWQVEWCFDNPVTRHVPEGQKQSAQGPTLTKHGKPFKRIVFLKIFQWARRMEFWETFRQILPESQKFSAHCPSSLNFSLNVRKKLKIFKFFFKSEVLLKMTLRKRKMDSWQSPQKKPEKSRNFPTNTRSWTKMIILLTIKILSPRKFLMIM